MAGAVGWTPATFWSSTLPELYHFMRGVQKAHGVDPDKNTAPLPPITPEEFEEMVRQDEARRHGRGTADIDGAA